MKSQSGTRRFQGFAGLVIERESLEKRIRGALRRARIEDPWLASQPLVGGIDPFVDSTDVLSFPYRAKALYSTPSTRS